MTLSHTSTLDRSTALGLMASIPLLASASPGYADVKPVDDFQSPPDRTKEHVIVNTHRHVVGPKLAAKMAKRGLYDSKKEFPQTNPPDFVCYQDFVDPDYAMPKQRAAGVTLSVASNSGEVEWIAHDLLQVRTGDALKFINDEYLVVRDRFDGDFALMANALRWKRVVGRSLTK